MKVLAVGLVVLLVKEFRPLKVSPEVKKGFSIWLSMV